MLKWCIWAHCNEIDYQHKPQKSGRIFYIQLWPHKNTITIEPHYLICTHAKYFSLVLSVSALVFPCVIIPTQKSPHKGAQTMRRKKMNSVHPTKLQETINMFVINIFWIERKDKNACNKIESEREKKKRIVCTKKL